MNSIYSHLQWYPTFLPFGGGHQTHQICLGMHQLQMVRSVLNLYKDILHKGLKSSAVAKSWQNDHPTVAVMAP